MCMRKTVFVLHLMLVVTIAFCQKQNNLPFLKVSANKRFLMTDDGKPFFWLGDTGWLLFSKLNREEAEKYLDDRANKGFNVVQVMVLHQLKLANAYGDSALTKGNVSLPKRTNGNTFKDENAYDFWDHVDYILTLAESKGLYMALVPVWGTNVSQGGVTLEEADQYSSWLAKRYANRSNIIWLNGGDTKGGENGAVWNIIGRRLREHAPKHLITFHPFGRTKSSTWFHDATWLSPLRSGRYRTGVRPG